MAKRNLAGLKKVKKAVRRKGRTVQQTVYVSTKPKNKPVNHAKGGRAARPQAMKQRGPSFGQRAAHVAAAVLPVLGGAIGSTIGEIHGARLANRAADHLSARAGSMGTYGAFGATALHGVSAILRSQGGNLASMAGGAIGTSLGGSAGFGAYRLAHRGR